jgi:lysyl-tRNA synthetase class 2
VADTSAKPANPSGGWRETFATAAGRLVLLAGLWSMVSIVLHRVPAVRWVDEAFGLLNLPVAPSLFSVTMLLVLGGALQRRKRIALWVLFGFQGLAAATALVVSGVVLSTDHEFADATRAEWLLLAGSATAASLLLVLLWRSRRAFPSRLQRGALRRAVGVLAAGLMLSTTTSIVLTTVFPGRLHSQGRRLIWAARSALGSEPNSREAGWQVEHGHHWIAAVVGAISALALLAATLVFFKSASSSGRLAAQDELDIRRLLLANGDRDSLGYFATRHDKAVVFGADREAAVTYRVVASVSLASADPIGPPSAWRPAIDAWLARSQEFGWLPAVLSASEEGAKAYVAAGLKAMPIGDEAIIDVAAFTLEGPTMQPVRRAVNRVRIAGYTITTVRHSELSDHTLAEITQRAEDWRGDAVERGFSMALSRLGDRADGRCLAVLAHDSTGALRGVLSFVPWGSHGASLDLMRRDQTAENGLMEAMVAALVDSGKDLGIRHISLNFAMFRGVFSAAERVGAGPLVRIANRGLVYASRFWQLESLYRSNDRYLPRWEPRYLCYDSSLTLTRVALAAGMAEGFLPAPLGPSAARDDGKVSYQGRSDVPFLEAVHDQEVESRHRVPAATRLTEQERIRRGKIELLVAAGQQPYPVSVPQTDDIAAVTERAADRWHDLPADGFSGEQVSLTGRVRAVRDFGGLVFAVLQDGPASIQAILDRETLGPESHELFRSAVDVGDHISVTGGVGLSKHGQLSVFADTWTMASKCLRPLPDLRTGITDPDTRVRQRHLHLIANPEAMQLMLQRSTAVKAIRDAFAGRGFVEVETPMLQAVHGGANARPFTTHINAYNTELYLRIAPELYLKRLCVGGMRKVFELNRNFRNEGADATHNPEFTSVEAYRAHADYNDMRVLTRELIIEVATAVYGAPVAKRSDGAGGETVVDLSGEWPVITVHDAVSRACKVSITPDTTAVELLAVCAQHRISVSAAKTAGEIVVELYEELVEKHTTEPTFYTDFPIETSPLTRVHRDDPRLAERWDLVAFGAELGTAYSELIDPIDQRRRLVAQSLKAANGDPEAMQVDEAFLTAMEYAMPPTGGLGLGVDRLVMMLTGASIRQTLAFPFVRPVGQGVRSA